MSQYTNQPRPDTDPINDPRNAILLRSDIHTFFDYKRWVMAPKLGKLVAHILTPRYGQELQALYHNVEIQPMYGVAVEFVIARFAWAVFTLAHDFLGRGCGRTLMVRGEDGESKAKNYSSQQCMQLLRSKSRSRSLKKRVRDDASMTNEDEDFDEGITAVPERGRLLKRSFKTFSTTSSSSRDGSAGDRSASSTDTTSFDRRECEAIAQETEA